MATNIGRVEFLVDLDGDRIPAQARALGQQIAAAGTESGKDFGDNFDTEFEKSLTASGKKAAKIMADAGDLAGKSFTEDFNDSVKSRSRSIQKTLAGTLADKDALAKSFEGFNTVTEAIQHYERELKAANESIDNHADSLLEAADAEEKRRAAMEKSKAALKEIAIEQEKVNAQVDKLKRLSKDSTALENAATKSRRSLAEVTATMREEMKGLHEANVVNQTDVERFNDSLERSIEIIEERQAKEAKAADDKLKRDARQAASDDRQAKADVQREQDRIDRIARLDAADERRDRADAQRALDRIARDVKAAESAEELGRRRSLASLKAQAAFDASIEKEDFANEKHERSAGLIDKITGAWRRMDGTVKLVIVSIVAAADEVAVLGSALGGGIIALGGALSAVAVGGLGLVGLFKSLNQEVGDAPAALRPTIRQLDKLKETFSGLDDVIAKGAVGTLGGAFKQINTNLKDLSPAFTEVGAVLGDLIHDFGDATKASNGAGSAFDEINKSIHLGIGNFDDLARSAGQLGVALLRSFNRAQPLVEDLTGWIGRLVRQFDAFTRSTGFDAWIADAQKVFGAFGELLDQIGRSLNNLASPEAVGRTVEFLDNLTRFTPSLETLLDTMGELDVFGLAAQALADFGEAMAPLAAPSKELAEALNGLLVVAIQSFADVAATLAPIIATLVDGFAGFVDAIPPSTIAGIATALTVLGVAIGALNSVIVVSTFVTWAKKATLAAEGMGPAAGAAAKGIGKIGKAAGIFGLVVVGAGVLTSAFKILTNAAEYVPPSIDAITAALNGNGGINKAFSTASQYSDTFAESIALVAKVDFQNVNARLTEMAVGLAGIRTPVTDARDGIQALDDSLAGLVAGGDATQAIQTFEELKKTAQAQGVSIGDLAKQFPHYKDALEAAHAANERASDGFHEVGAASEQAKKQIQILDEAIRGFGDAQLSANEAERGFQAAIDQAAASYGEFGATLDLNTEQGRANSAALDAIAASAKQSSDAVKDSTGSQEKANAKLEEGRLALVAQAEQFGLTHDEAVIYALGLGLAENGNSQLTNNARVAHGALVLQLQQFGLTAEEAEIYAGKLEAIPSDLKSNIALLGTEAAINGAEGVKTAIDNVKSKTVTLTLRTTQSGDPIYRSAAGNLLTAAGGMFDAPQMRIIGEAGPEAVVPLRRPLSMVDPAVRSLSAFAQGKGPAPYMGAPASPSRTLNIQPGAIVIQGDRAPEATATNVVNRIARRLI